jgi:glycosyltransferase involved in cell wall biosynthesis
MKIIINDFTSVKKYPNMWQDRGLGASDMFVFMISQRLQQNGHQVILNTNTDFVGVDPSTGVYWSNEIREGTDECDVLLVQRLPFKHEKVKYKKMILMCHDNIDAPVMKNLDKFMSKPDAVMVLSKYHREQLLKWNVPIEKIFILPEGIRTRSRYNSTIGVEEKNVVYSSAPFKGFPLLMKLWGRLKEEVPDIKLHVCTGMDLYCNTENDHYFKELYDKARDDPSIVFHGVVTNKDVLDVVANCRLMVYPNIFAETFCLSAMESIALSVPVITSDLGALPETVGDCGIIIKGDPKSEEYQTKFVKAVKQFFNDRYLELALRNNCCERTILFWEEVADYLEEKILEVMK